MRLNKENRRLLFYQSVEDILHSREMQLNRELLQHGRVSIFTHCFMVAFYSFRVAEKLRGFNLPCLARGAMLHDFFLYDWHMKRYRELHGFFHPGIAAKNARTYFSVNALEEEIITKHMWPLTLRRFPKTRESWLVCLIDKYCSLLETLRINRYSEESVVRIIDGFIEQEALQK